MSRKRDKQLDMLMAALLILMVALALHYCSTPVSGAADLQQVETEPAAEPGRIPGDDVPAREKAWPSADWEDQQDYENERIEAALLEKAHRLDDVIVTHYDVCVECCGKVDGIGAAGRKVVPFVSAAVDPRVIPLGSDVLVDYNDGTGVHYYRADDTGGAIKGKRVDLCVSDHQTALQLGKKTATVYWVAQED